MALFRRAPRPEVAPLIAARLPDCARIHAESFHRGWDEDELAGLLRDGSVVADACVDARSGDLLGFALSRRALDEAEILTIAIGRRHRGSGLGRALLDRHLERLRGLGVASVFLEVETGNAAALALYRRGGFRRVGERRGYYATASGAPATALILRRDG